jgi:hypothetical protein
MSDGFLFACSARKSLDVPKNPSSSKTQARSCFRKQSTAYHGAGTPRDLPCPRIQLTLSSAFSLFGSNTDGTGNGALRKQRAAPTESNSNLWVTASSAAIQNRILRLAFDTLEASSENARIQMLCARWLPDDEGHGKSSGDQSDAKVGAWIQELRH